MSNYLVEDLQVDVLSRLPVKSLQRFKCVSKKWRAFIESPDFILMHLNRSSLRLVIGSTRQAVDSIGLVKRYHLSSAKEFDSWESFRRTRKEVCCPLEDFPSRKSQSKDDRVIKFVGSCNGLVCLQYSRYGVLVWNPWIRKHWIIPPTRVETELYQGSTRILPYCRFSYGFGYDGLNDDYKVVRMVQLLNINNIPIGVEAKVFSLKSNLWRRIQDFPYTLLRTAFFEGFLANGALHWMSSNLKSHPRYSIVAIDLATEEHRLLPTPEPESGTCGSLSGLCGKLSFFTDKWWVMQEDSWRVIDMEHPYKMRPIAYSADGRNLIFQNSDKLIWFNNEKTLVQSLVYHARGFSCDIFCSVASLVEPNCGGEKGIKRRKKDLKRKDASLKRSSGPAV